MALIDNLPGKVAISVSTWPDQEKDLDPPQHALDPQYKESNKVLQWYSFALQIMYGNVLVQVLCDGNAKGLVSGGRSTQAGA